ncbi:MAG: response regulator [Pseudomonadales bacterium]
MINMDTLPYVLLVEDDERLANLIQEYLTKHGFLVRVQGRGDLAVADILESKPDLLVLDIMLPGIDGLEVCRRVRQQFTAPILMLTARDEDIDQIVGLELGADDYINKPVQPRLLLARIKAHLRRASTAHPTFDQESLSFGTLHLDLVSRETQLNNQNIELSTNEFDVLALLASNAGKVLDRDTILQAIRGIEYDGIDRSVDIAVSRLRRKLGDEAQPAKRIKTVRNKGYLFVADSWD